MRKREKNEVRRSMYIVKLLKIGSTIRKYMSNQSKSVTVCIDIDVG